VAAPRSKEAVALVWQFLASNREGVLSTHSVSRSGYPFGSLAPYALTERGEPLLLLSDLAEHTRNLQADARASLFVREEGAIHAQAAMRVTLLGMVSPAPDDAALRERYVARHPSAQAYFQLGGFGLYVLHTEHLRVIERFGEMGWLSAPFD